MEWMSDWIRQIILIIFIATFIDLLLPSSSLERYVKLIMGLIIIVSILQPVLQLVLHEDKWLKVSTLLAPALDMDQYTSLRKIQENSSELTRVQQEAIKQQFQSSITSWIEKQVAQKYHVKVVSAKVIANIDQETPVIQKIEVKGVKTGESPASEVVKSIEPIEISRDMKKEEMSKQDAKVQQEIQYFIGSAWNIDTKQVAVQIQCK
ncbi:stage III sporulation protein AF [Shimazuella sp. AN120528]|uniref:stage III sporulation protein AF n=1 Tax=Shimazuella soli TaxID=1892854 RepID=UPI001F0D50D0|nr:stage III sporulation protein AF [Shimazuella soli]MCH5584182.1 stage III sporulation protein AF [Shimazuella soli]